ncbi:helix-turn-helix domain-containing protein, partial [Cohnella lubricantis]|uniref:helix-turn-helix domain-containing protein n=1 Tax=Cohnella lubricantis TaxID=2163172 RepID=UPI001AE2C627
MQPRKNSLLFRRSQTVGLALKQQSEKFGINKSTIVKWRRRYQVYGYEGLEARTHNR